ncbi:MAG TPA: Holliday junction branch migration protein RuvA [Bacilli bacterium]
MIDFLRGSVAHVAEDYVVIDVGGVGYRVFCANPYVFAKRENEAVTVYIHYYVREYATLLFGFATRQEQALFRQLLDVSGIGPKVALGVLSGGTPDAIIASIRQENIAYLTRLPGIGKKTAQRIILDLKDKLGVAPTTVAGINAAERELSADSGASPWAEAKAGLLALGYTEAETEAAWAAIRDKAETSDKPDVLLKLALQALYKK